MAFPARPGQRRTTGDRPRRRRSVSRPPAGREAESARRRRRAPRRAVQICLHGWYILSASSRSPAASRRRPRPFRRRSRPAGRVVLTFWPREPAAHRPAPAHRPPCAPDALRIRSIRRACRRAHRSHQPACHRPSAGAEDVSAGLRGLAWRIHRINRSPAGRVGRRLVASSELAWASARLSRCAEWPRGGMRQRRRQDVPREGGASAGASFDPGEATDI